MKKQTLLQMILLGIFIVFSAASSFAAAEKLAKMNWSDRNHAVLNNLITNYGVGGKHYDAKKPPYVVIDWDQTSAHFDCEEATMRYQLTNLKFKMTKEQFKGLFKDEINGIKNLSSEYNNIALKDINEDIISHYNFLYDNYEGLGGKLKLDEIRKTPQFKDFIAKMAFVYDGYCDTPGIGATYGYPWVIYWFAGYTKDEVRKITDEALKYELNNKLAKAKWETPEVFKTKAGAISYSYKTGLRVFPEMMSLYSAFRANGIDVFVITASYGPVVEVFSGRYGYNVPADKVIGMEIAEKDGILLPYYKEGYPQTQRMGKVEVINMKIKKELGRDYDPLFSAGDSDGDYEMSTEYPGMKLTLVFNRLKGGDIGKLCKQAVAEKDKAEPRVILQGRDENTGMLLPQSESILLGKTEAKLLK